ncbi:hypothetical protein BDV96DRAFT_77448 [Lophiotrema nucula]|uniref:Uncharacterized protein n=1 Tax=Lophiotrema nucula TaxID=690887 RepID=A0A6A5Z7L0_9PLEO|nr:hypothetical protein BDV96DRAFT_77448 [Lophiotrema nucula]
MYHYSLRCRKPCSADTRPMHFDGPVSFIYRIFDSDPDLQVQCDWHVCRIWTHLSLSILSLALRPQISFRGLGLESGVWRTSLHLVSGISSLLALRVCNIGTLDSGALPRISLVITQSRATFFCHIPCSRSISVGFNLFTIYPAFLPARPLGSLGLFFLLQVRPNRRSPVRVSTS